MAFVPPANNPGLPVPVIPADPPLDITNTKDYVERLTQSKDDEIGAAKLFHHQGVLRTSLGGVDLLPLATIVHTLNQMQQTNQEMQQTNQAMQQTYQAMQQTIQEMQQTHQAMQQTHQATQQTIQEMQQTIQGVEQTVQRIEQKQEHMSAVIENMRIAKANKKLAENSGITMYHAKQKEVDGDGTILANAVVYSNNQILAPLAEAPTIGTVFSPRIETRTLNHLTILRLIQFYHQDFDIQPGDTIAIRVQKIANWLTSGI